METFERLGGGGTLSPLSRQSGENGADEVEAMIVAIDGPAGAGKSSVARALAKALGFRFLDTGAMYRAITWKALEDGIDLEDAQAIGRLVQQVDLQLDGDIIRLNGREIDRLIRTPRVTKAIRYVADNVEVRRFLSQLQRQLSQGGDLVTEGRDQGTEVFPDAECKIFLTASDRERARRRYRELLDRGEAATEHEVLQQLQERDRQDERRPVGALRKAEDAVELVTDGLGVHEVVRRLEEIVKQKAASLR